MKKEYTINQHLDKLLSKYDTPDIIEDELLFKLFNRLMELKIALGGRTFINPVGETKELIDCKLT